MWEAEDFRRGTVIPELFIEHAAPSAVAAQLKQWKSGRDRLDRQIETLEALHAQKLTEPKWGDRLQGKD
jgi:lipid A disaccharide synthetase